MWCGGPPRRAGRASPAPSSRRKRGSRHSSARGTAVVTGAPPCHGLFAAGGVFPAAGLVVVVHALPSRFHARERAARHATWCQRRTPRPPPGILHTVTLGGLPRGPYQK